MLICSCCIRLEMWKHTKFASGLKRDIQANVGFGLNKLNITPPYDCRTE